MLKIIQSIKKQYTTAIFSLIVLCSFFICALNADVSSNTPSNCAPADAHSTIQSADPVYHEIISEERTGITVIKEILSRGNRTRRASTARGGIENAIAVFLLTLIFCYASFQLFSNKTIPCSHLIIITYIHNLDGMKS